MCAMERADRGAGRALPQRADRDLPDGARMEAWPAEPLGQLPLPVRDPGEFLAWIDHVINTVAATLVEGVDYGLIPNTNAKSLWQPGAEKLCLAFSLAPECELVEWVADHDRTIEWEKRRKSGEIIRGTSIGFYAAAVRCRIRSRRTGELIAEALGYASTVESKYVDRPRELENTIQAMAEKRAFVRAVRRALALSGRFDDLDEADDHAAPEPRRDRSSDRSSDRGNDRKASRSDNGGDRRAGRDGRRREPAAVAAELIARYEAATTPEAVEAARQRQREAVNGGLLPSGSTEARLVAEARDRALQRLNGPVAQAGYHALLKRLRDAADADAVRAAQREVEDSRDLGLVDDAQADELRDLADERLAELGEPPDGPAGAGDDDDPFLEA